jgi:HAE1 family hydrophobic/amphiphilic exporter-1
MLTATILAVFFVPAFYVAMQSLIELRNGPPKLRVGEVIHAPHEDELPPDSPPADQAFVVKPVPTSPIPAPAANGPDAAPAETKKPPASPGEKAPK